ncbi:hypothetical protein DKX38_013532 [Salix brachista]|uniref:Uncharacterized protein n=1 Tax=Salix brachista TaxID=2182728 RepID=A0A5N5LRV4_9ROSI|nr:hypothetical protein DKX38_013532 [Salix brachista]
MAGVDNMLVWLFVFKGVVVGEIKLVASEGETKERWKEKVRSGGRVRTQNKDLVSFIFFVMKLVTRLGIEWNKVVDVMKGISDSLKDFSL